MKSPRKLTICILAAALLLVVQIVGIIVPVQAKTALLWTDSILDNGNFEMPDIGTQGYQVYYAGAKLGNWVVESGSVDIVHYWQAADGRQSLDLEGYGVGAIYQDLYTPVLQTYVLRFAFSGNPDGSPRVKTMRVWWGSTLLDTLTFDIYGHSSSNMGWEYHQYVVTSVSAFTRLRFEALTSGWSYGPVIDAVSVQPYSGTLPALDVPLEYSGKKFSEVALGLNNGGRVNSWFDHETPDYNLNQELRLWNGTVQSDTIGTPCTYGLNCYDGHNGIDYQRQYPNADWIYPAAPGKVVGLCTNSYPCSQEISLTDDSGYGRWVLIQHGESGNYGKYATLYAHLDSVNPNLSKGTIITDTKLITVGVMGSTGTDAIHLHFGLYYDADGNGRWANVYKGPTEAVDPYGWLGQSNDPWSITSFYLWKYPLWDKKTGGMYGAILTSPSGRGKITIPFGALGYTATLELWDIVAPAPPSSQLRSVGNPVWLRVLRAPSQKSDGGHSLIGRSESFTQPVSINMNYETAQIRHSNLSSLKIYQWDEIGKTWNPVTTTINNSAREATAQSFDTGMFQLQAPLLCPTDSIEPDDTYGTSVYISSNGTPVNRVLDSSQDEDWFRMDATTGRMYIIRTSNLATGIDTVLEIYNRDLTRLAINDDSGGSQASLLAWIAPSDGIYFLRVTGYSGSASGCNATYQLSVTEKFPVFLPIITRNR
jgi:choice-of-anchor C domain-containing protein